jgi:hypothetical protein
MPDQADPIAYFLTWTTYGTWLPGDERGWYAKQASGLQGMHSDKHGRSC